MERVKTVPLTEEHYRRIWEEEKHNGYPAIDRLEKHWGYAVERGRLEEAARVLACPFKVHAPNWQHGRVIYTVASVYLSNIIGQVHMLDIGTAKGFSALMMRWAADDAVASVRINSVDVIGPGDRVRRNTVAEVGELKTLGEILEPWKEEAEGINFHQATGVSFLSEYTGRVHFAFVDGKHRYESVRMEGALLHMKQESGDVAIFDDVQIEGVAKAVDELRGYEKCFIAANDERRYCIATRE
jgi:predicted O-methyltransferase YrrM